MKTCEICKEAPAFQRVREEREGQTVVLDACVPCAAARDTSDAHALVDSWVTSYAPHRKEGGPRTKPSRAEPERRERGGPAAASESAQRPDGEGEAPEESPAAAKEGEEPRRTGDAEAAKRRSWLDEVEAGAGQTAADGPARDRAPDRPSTIHEAEAMAVPEARAPGGGSPWVAPTREEALLDPDDRPLRGGPDLGVADVEEEREGESGEPVGGRTRAEPGDLDDRLEQLEQQLAQEQVEAELRAQEAERLTREQQGFLEEKIVGLQREFREGIYEILREARGEVLPDELGDGRPDPFALWQEYWTHAAHGEPPARATGDLSLHLPRSLHAQLLEIAEREGVSVEELATSALAAFAGHRLRRRSAGGGTP